MIYFPVKTKERKVLKVDKSLPLEQRVQESYTLIIPSKSMYVRLKKEQGRMFTFGGKTTTDADYTTFKIPKKSGGLREIKAPNKETKELQKSLAQALNRAYKIHPAAYAYVEERSCIDAIRKHQARNARWFLKLDLKDFFPSITKEFVIEQLSKIWIAESHSIHITKVLAEKGNCAFLNNTLPQGSPASPTISNIIMIPIDTDIEILCKKFQITYTRYADDLLFSSPYSWDYQEFIKELETRVLNKTPFKIKTEKTRYGSFNGSNWNLGLMYNNKQDITVGYKNKKYFKAMLFSCLSDFKNNVIWEAEDLNHLIGLHAHYKFVEPEYFKTITKRLELKTGVSFETVRRGGI